MTKQDKEETNTTQANMPNPASVYCEKNGGKLEIRTNEKGQYGVCKFSNGSECEEWAYFRGQCKPKETTNNTINNTI